MIKELRRRLLIVGLALLFSFSSVTADHPVAKVSQHLVNSGGVAVAGDAVEDKEFVMLFFSAHWCPPCRRFTPRLVEFYRQNGGGEVFEIIFVSSDRSEEAMLDYMKAMKMQWPAVDYSEIEATGIKSLGGPFLPSLVLLDAEGNVLASAFDESIDDYVGPDAVLQKLRQLL